MGLEGSRDGNPLDGLTYEHDSEFIAENNELGFYGDGMVRLFLLISISTMISFCF